MAISTIGSETVCETGPKWTRDLFVKILDGTKSISDNQVTVQRSTDDNTVTLQSDVTLRVEIQFPGFLPLPLGPLERSGSESLQGLLDQQMAPVLAKFRSDYLVWEAGRP